jgi:hypothetical protein
VSTVVGVAALLACTVFGYLCGRTAKRRTRETTLREVVTTARTQIFAARALAVLAPHCSNPECRDGRRQVHEALGQALDAATEAKRAAWRR